MTKHKTVTLETLASKLNLSKYSVSRALTGKQGVSEDTRKAVFELAAKLGYDHPTVASPRSRPNTLKKDILLLLPKNRAFDSEFWIGVMGGAEEEAQRLGFNLITRSFEPGSALSHDIDPRVQGLIGIGQPSRELIESLPDPNLPVTLITHPRTFEPFDTVTTRNWEGGVAAGKHLFDLGHTRILFISDVTPELTREERARGLRDAALAYHDVQIETLHVDMTEAATQCEACLAGLRKKKAQPTAIFCARDDLAFTVIWTLGRLGLSVPDDMSVMGFTDGAMASQFHPKLTTIRSPVKDLGTAAMQNTFRRIERRDPNAAPRHIAVSPSLIVRESTAPAR